MKTMGGSNMKLKKLLFRDEMPICFLCLAIDRENILFRIKIHNVPISIYVHFRNHFFPAALPTTRAFFYNFLCPGFCGTHGIVWTISFTRLCSSFLPECSASPRRTAIGKKKNGLDKHGARVFAVENVFSSWKNLSR